ncbi:hypothetical protein HA402_015863 [Bradysia odoriphaga]|nr:hypothetical protein HA402_015863 [Bradysia odoriphaga]
MKTILITFAIIAVATAAPIEEETKTMGDVVQIVRSSQVFEADGSYKFSFETADGSIREETGTIVNPGKEDAYVARVGLYRFTNPSGEVVEVRYTADTKGYVPRGTNIPTVPDVVIPTVPTVPDVVVPTVSDAVLPTVPDTVLKAPAM